MFIKKELVLHGETDSGMAPHAPMPFDDYVSYLGGLHPWYQPIAELAVLTGLRLSEMADIDISDIRHGHVVVRTGKTRCSRRKIPITSSIQRVLDL